MLKNILFIDILYSKVSQLMILPLVMFPYPWCLIFSVIELIIQELKIIECRSISFYDVRFLFVFRNFKSYHLNYTAIVGAHCLFIGLLSILLFSQYL